MQNTAVQPDRQKAQTDSPLLRATNIRKTFRMGESSVQVLKGVDLSVKAGEFIAIEGRSGSGKDKGLHILGVLDEAEGCGLEFEGRNILALSSSERSKLRNTQFVFVVQFYHHLPE